MSFIAHLPKQVVLGVHSIQELSKILIDLRIKKVFIIYSASAMKDYLQSLKEKLPNAVFYEISKGEPTIDELQRATNYMQDKQCDGVVAIGGGAAGGWLHAPCHWHHGSIGCGADGLGV